MGRPALEHGLQQIGATQGRLPGSATVLIGLVAALIVFLPGVWAAGRHLYTLAHEGSHAFMASAVGMKVTSLTMKMDGTGLTVASKSSPFNVFLFQFFGYLGPSAMGVGAAKLIQVGHAVAVLWVLLLALVLLAFTARKAFAWACILGTGLLLYWVARYATVGTEVVAAYGITWFLLISGIAMVLRHWRLSGGDHALLKSTTRLPRWLWPPLWLAGTAAALITGAALLI